MRLEEFDYDLPPERVAQRPSERRDESRLLVLNRALDRLDETSFAGLPDLLRPGDLVVVNDTRVLPARLFGLKPTGGRVELLILGGPGPPGGDAARECMVSPAKGLHPGTRLVITPGIFAVVATEPDGGRLKVRFETSAGEVASEETIRGAAVMPLPPYIRREPDDPLQAMDRERYQTLFAARDGAVAAPTAGLHFTPRVLDALRARRVELATVTLHVGPGTFQPVRSAAIEDHRVEAETFVLPAATAVAIAACKARGGRVVAVGTTVTRVLEARATDNGAVRPGDGWCDLYILPGHRFKVVDALITNLHLPRSSLLILVAAFAGREPILSAYREAIRRGLRFYSYGDAMLIL